MLCECKRGTLLPYKYSVDVDANGVVTVINYICPTCGTAATSRNGEEATITYGEMTAITIAQHVIEAEFIEAKSYLVRLVWGAKTKEPIADNRQEIERTIEYAHLLSEIERILIADKASECTTEVVKLGRENI